MNQTQEKLVTDNLALVYHLFGKLGQTDFVKRNADDIISEGKLGLIKAAKCFDPQHGTKFATFACRCITNQMLMFIRKCKRIMTEVSLFSPLCKDAEGNELLLVDVLSDNESFVHSLENSCDIVPFIKSLDERDRKMLAYKAHGYSQRQIGEQMGISQSYVSRLILRIKQKWVDFSAVT